jgi:threonyl-tRNA synthetase
MDIEKVGNFDPVEFDKDCVEKVIDAAKTLGYSHMNIVSGAGHDACWINRVAPTAMIMCPCVDGLSHNEAEEITKDLKSKGIRASLDSRSEKIGSKIRDAELQKINIMIIVGEKEVENKTVTVRRRFIKEQKELSLDGFSNEVLTEINERRVSN